LNNKPKTNTEFVGVKLTKETIDSLLKYSAKHHITQSEAIRRFIDKGLSVESYTAEQSLIRGYLREEIEAVLTKQTDRLIRLQLKATKAASTSMYASIAALADYFADDATYENVVAQALLQAAIYMKQEEEPFEKYLQEAKEMIHASETIGKTDDN
jgi:dGTP triphosphohydrolase